MVPIVQVANVPSPRGAIVEFSGVFFTMPRKSLAGVLPRGHYPTGGAIVYLSIGHMLLIKARWATPQYGVTGSLGNYCGYCNNTLVKMGVAASSKAAAILVPGVGRLFLRE